MLLLSSCATLPHRLASQSPTACDAAAQQVAAITGAEPVELLPEDLPLLEELLGGRAGACEAAQPSARLLLRHSIAQGEGSESQATLKPFLSSETPSLRATTLDILQEEPSLDASLAVALKVLTTQDPEGSLPLFVALVSHQSSEVRVAAEAGVLAAPGGLDALLDLLGDAEREPVVLRIHAKAELPAELQAGAEPSGRLLWRRDLGSGTNRAAVCEGVLYVATAKDRLEALEIATGDQRWEWVAQEEELRGVACDAESVFIVDSGGRMSALQGEGQALWETTAPALKRYNNLWFDFTWSGPHLFLKQYKLLDPLTELMNFERETGEQIWSRSYEANYYAVNPPPVGEEHLVEWYWAADEDRRVRLVDASTGQVVREWPANEKYSTPIALDATAKGELYQRRDQLEARGFQGQSWELPLYAGREGFTLDGTLGLVGVVGKNTAYGQYDTEWEYGALHAVDIHHGTLLWSYQTADALSFLQPAVGNGEIYVNDEDGILYGIDPWSGAVDWSLSGGPGRLSLPPIVEGGRIVLVSSGGTTGLGASASVVVPAPWLQLARTAEPALVEKLLGHPSPGAQRSALRALRLSGEGETAYRAHLERLTNEDRALATEALGGLVALGDTRALDPILALLGTGPHDPALVLASLHRLDPDWASTAAHTTLSRSSLEALIVHWRSTIALREESLSLENSDACRSARSAMSLMTASAEALAEGNYELAGAMQEEFDRLGLSEFDADICMDQVKDCVEVSNAQQAHFDTITDPDARAIAETLQAGVPRCGQ